MIRVSGFQISWHWLHWSKKMFAILIRHRHCSTKHLNPWWIFKENIVGRTISRIIFQTSTDLGSTFVRRKKSMGGRSQGFLTIVLPRSKWVYFWYAKISFYTLLMVNFRGKVWSRRIFYDCFINFFRKKMWNKRNMLVETFGTKNVNQQQKNERMDT